MIRVRLLRYQAAGIALPLTAESSLRLAKVSWPTLRRDNSPLSFWSSISARTRPRGGARQPVYERPLAEVQIEQSARPDRWGNWLGG
jgi:hypothetical protein